MLKLAREANADQGHARLHVSDTAQGTLSGSVIYPKWRLGKTIAHRRQRRTRLARKGIREEATAIESLTTDWFHDHMEDTCHHLIA